MQDMKNMLVRFKDIEFNVGNTLWLNIWNFKMPKALASWFILKCVGSYKVILKSHLDVYTLLLLTIFLAHPTFHVSMLKSFNDDKRRSMDRKQAYHLIFYFSELSL
jgi:hypothetical protein